MEKFMGLVREAVIVDLKSVSPDRKPLLEPLKSSAELNLFHWKHPCDVQLPPLPERQSEQMKFDQLFEPFQFDELEEIARNADGSLKKLSSEQLKSIRGWGNFEVESVKFPGQKHKWQLSWFLQKGTDRDKKNLNLALARALKFFVIYAKDRYNAKFFSFGHTYRGVSKGLLMFVDLIIGRPHNVPVDPETKLASERLAHLLSELELADEADLAKIEAFAELIESRLKWSRSYNPTSTDSDYKFKEKRDAIPTIYNYTTSGSQVAIDLRCRNQQLWGQLSPRISVIIEGFRQSGWFHQFRHDLFLRYKDDLTDNDKLVEKVQKEVDEEQINRVFNALKADEQIERICHGAADFLLAIAKANMICGRVEEQFNTKLSVEWNELEANLTNQYPIRSKINRWMRRQRKEFEAKFHETHKWSRYEWAMKEAQAEGLGQFAYFLQRDLNFVRDQQPNLQLEMEKITEPARIFTFRTRIWFPSNWVVTKRDEESGNETVIKTVVSKEIIPEQTGLIPGWHRGPPYAVRKSIDRNVSTKWPFWRWGNYFHRVWAWTWNAVFTLCVIIPWCSPFSIRAALYHRQFYPDYKLSQENGQLHPDPHSGTHTYVSRLRALWSHIRKSRAQFEAAADRGFLSKNVVRPLNRLWNYVVKGAIGSIILTAFPPLCIFVSLGSFALGILAPVFMPVVTLLAHLFMLLIYDFDCPYKHRTYLRRNRILLMFEAIVYRLVFLSVVQPVGIVIFVGLICPLCATLITVGAYLRYGIRSAWDAVLFHILIKRHGRIPAVNSWVAKRTAGPGLSGRYFYQIQPGQALALFQLELQRRETTTFEQFANEQLSRPLNAYQDWVKTTLTPFGVEISTQHDLYGRVNGPSVKIRSDLHEKLAKRRQFLNSTTRYDQNFRLVKLTADDLQITMDSAANLVEKFYSASPVLSLVDLAEFFTQHQLARGDWRSFAEKIFVEIFSDEFLQPLEATDSRFELKVQHVDLKDYIDQLITAKHTEDLDRVERQITKAPKGENSVSPRPLTPQLFSCQSNQFSPATNDPVGRRLWSELPGYQPHPTLAMAFVAAKRQLHGVKADWLREPSSRAFVVELASRQKQIRPNGTSADEIELVEDDFDNIGQNYTKAETHRVAV